MTLLSRSSGKIRTKLTVWIWGGSHSWVSRCPFKAMIFDLDGTLVQTERLKAISYARATVALCSEKITEEEVVDAFKEVVGLPRREVAQALMERFHLEPEALHRMAEFGVETPWQVYIQVRMGIYEAMLADPQVLLDHRWPHALALLNAARRAYCRLGLATQSRCEQARHVLQVLKLETAFDFIATREDVERGKPDPEIYLLVAQELGVAPQACLVVDDSPAGVQAAVAAGMAVVAVSTPFTRRGLHASGLLPKGHIVDDPGELPGVVRHVLDHLP